MKAFLMLVAACALSLTLAGCNNNKTNTNKASPGAMRECPKCASGTCTCMCCKAGGARMATATGCCCEPGNGVCCKDMNKSNMGAVGDKKSGCCSEAGKSDTSMGAVDDSKPGCCSGAHSGCGAAKTSG